MNCDPPGSSVCGILQARILEWGAVPSSRGSFQSRYQTGISYASCIARRVPYDHSHLGSKKPVLPAPNSCPSSSEKSLEPVLLPLLYATASAQGATTVRARGCLGEGQIKVKAAGGQPSPSAPKGSDEVPESALGHPVSDSPFSDDWTTGLFKASPIYL